MDKDYKNFVERMHSFDMDIDIDPELETRLETEEKVGDFLMHHGIKGMKWGVRKPENQRRNRSNNYSQDFKVSRDLKSRHQSSLSNSELQKLITRQNLEQQYRRLNPTTVDRGKSAVKGIVAAGTTLTTLYSIANSKAVNSLVNKARRG